MSNSTEFALEERSDNAGLDNSLGNTVVMRPRGRPKSRSRHDRILQVACQLFAERGYGAVSINDIGLGAGISGPGIYRHFASKESILIALFDRLHETLDQCTTSAFEGDPSPDEALERLIAAHARRAITERDVFQCAIKEREHLPEYSRTQTLSHQREYVDAWTGLLERVSSGYSSEQLRTAAYGVIWMLNSVEYHHSSLDDESQVELLKEMALSAIRRLAE